MARSIVFVGQTMKKLGTWLFGTRRRQLATCLVAVLLGTEAVVRFMGVVDVPVYLVDEGIGYLPQANQSGAFLRKNRWVFNDRSMPIASAWSPGDGHGINVLVIGNSIVMGGNPYDQKDKLGPLMQESLGSGFRVWPIGAGGWTNVNESVYLERNPDVVGAAQVFVWDYMAGGLSQLSPWNGDYVFPHARPLWATWYVFRRYVLPRFVTLNMNELPPVGDVSTQNAQRFEACLAALTSHTGSGRGIIFLYPKKKELLLARRGEEWLPERKLVESLAAKYGIKIVDLARHPAWQESSYREDVHPNIDGNVALAKILSNEVKAIVGQGSHP